MSTYRQKVTMVGQFLSRAAHFGPIATMLMMIAFFYGRAFAQESPHGPIRFECQTCHVPDSWTMRKDSPFNHAKSGFALEGGHKATTCESCHKEMRFAKQKSDCVSCHTDVHKRELGDNCQRCHSPQTWKIADMVQKHQQTRFPLLGRHASAACVTCHRTENARQYAGASTNCIDCHRSDYLSAKNPSHVGAGFTTDCESCHDISAMRWSGGGFDHNRTSFPLTGAHVAVQCQSCHTNGNYRLVYNGCFQCHSSDFAGASNPNHITGGFSHNCEQCHSTINWSGATFDHSTTNFPLTGAHVATQCQSCHVNGNYQLTYTDCYQCHATDFNGTTNPNHVTGNFSHNCTECHTTVSWSPATFDHATTNFPLTGAHTTATCQSCHVNGNYQLTYTDCYQCHAGDFNGATNPNHVLPGFSHDCTLCHTTNTWAPSTFNHDAQYFRIYSGRHNNRWTLCSQCHQTPSNFSDFTCITCHEHRQSDVDPRHTGVPGYIYSATSCYNCHRNV